jgi:hypothetical protein
MAKTTTATKKAPVKRRRTPKAVEAEVTTMPPVEEAVVAEVVATPQAPAAPAQVKRVRDPNMVADCYLKTPSGVLMLVGQDGDEMRKHIETGKDYSPLDYRFFDDDNKRWAYWAVRDAAGNIRPLTFPDPTEYSLTSLVLYTKAVTYTRVLAHAVGLLKEKPATMWDKMLKPTTIIMAIVGIVFVMGLMLMALTG